MTTIILVTIGILLAASAALFVLFHGGDAFDQGSAKARAATLENAGLNVEAAVQGYHATNDAMPSSIADLRSGDRDARWLGDVMALRTAASGEGAIETVGGASYYLVPGVLDEGTCRRVNRDYSNADALPDRPAARRGCHSDGASFTYYVRLTTAGTSGPSSPTSAPVAPVVDPKPETGGTVEAYARFMRQSAEYARYVSASNLTPILRISDVGAPTEVARGIDGNVDDGRSIHVSGMDVTTKNGITYAIRSIAGGGASPDLCAAINAAAGNGAKTSPGTHLYTSIASYDEACGQSDERGLSYWRRIDDAPAAGQAAFLQRIGQSVSAAASTRPLASNATGLGLQNVDFKGLGAFRDFSGERFYNYEQRSYALIGGVPRAACAIIDRAGGGRGDVSSVFNARIYETQAIGDRISGCAGMDGEYQYWIRMDQLYVQGYATAFEQYTKLPDPSKWGGFASTGYFENIKASAGEWYDPQTQGYRSALLFGLRSKKACAAMGGIQDRVHFSYPRSGCVDRGGGYYQGYIRM